MQELPEQTRINLTQLNKIVAEVYKQAYRGNEMEQVERLKNFCEDLINSKK